MYKGETEKQSINENLIPRELGLEEAFFPDPSYNDNANEIDLSDYEDEKYLSGFKRINVPLKGILIKLSFNNENNESDGVYTTFIDSHIFMPYEKVEFYKNNKWINGFYRLEGDILEMPRRYIYDSDENFRDIVDVETIVKNYSYQSSILSILRSRVSLYKNFSKIQIFNFNFFSVEIDNELKMSDQTTLEKDGSNLFLFLYSLQEHNNSLFEKLLQDFNKIISYADNLKGINTKAYIERIYFTFKELQINESSQVEIPSWLWSTGSQKILALLSIIYNPKPAPLIIIEEFENGLDPWTIHYLIEKFRNFTIEKKSQVIITTHSPTLLDLLKYNEIVFAKRDSENGSLVYERFENEKKMFSDIQENILPGELYEKIRKEEYERDSLREEMQKISEQIEHRDRIKCLVFTEDKKQEDTPTGKKYLIEIILKASGFKMDEVSIVSYNGKSNLKVAILHSETSNKTIYPNLKRIIFHADRDINNDKFKDKHEEDIYDKIKDLGYLFYTKSYDVESYFLNFKHINAILSSRISNAQLEQFIIDSRSEKYDTSFNKLLEAKKNDIIDEIMKEKEAKEIAREAEGREKRVIIRDQIGWLKVIERLKDLYSKNEERYMYGKDVFDYFCGLIKTEYKINASIELLQTSEFVKDEELEKIAKEIWG